MLDRVLYWTNGHPYLTQRLCSAAASAGAACPADVDHACREQFLSPGARERDDNLLSVRDRLLGSSGDLAGLLTLYGRVLGGEAVPNDEASPLVTALKLAGVVRPTDGTLSVRNRIYGEVFGSAWVREHMPGAEVRRQQRAYRKGALRAAAVSAVVLVLVLSLASVAIFQTYRAAEAHRAAERARSDAADIIYASDMRESRAEWDVGAVGQVQALLDAHVPRKGSGERRGFEWWYMWRLCHRERVLFRGHTSLAYCVAFSPDGKTVASGGFDGTVRVWDVAGKRQAALLSFGRDAVLGVAYSPDGRHLAVGTRNGHVRTYDAATLREESRLEAGYDEYGMGVAYLPPSGRLLAVYKAAGPIFIWDPRTKSIVRRLPVPALAAGASPSGLVAVYRHPAGLTLIDPLAGRRTPVKANCPQGMTSLRWSPDGHTAAWGNGEGGVGLMDVTTGRLLWYRRAQTDWVNHLAFSPDGRWLASASWDYTVCLWDLRTRTPHLVRGHGDRVSGVAFSPDGRDLATASSDGTVRLWDVATVLRERDTVPGGTGDTGAGAISRDGRMLAEAVRPGQTTVRLRDVSGLSPSRLVSLPSGRINVLAVSPDGRVVYAGCEDGTVAPLDVATGRWSRPWKAHTAGVSRVVVSPDGRLVATTSHLDPPRLWTADTHQARPGPPAAVEAVTTVAFSPDSRLLGVARGSPGTIEVWDIAGRRTVATYPKAHGNHVQDLAFSPNGRWLVSCGWEGKVIVWSLQSGERPKVLPAHKGEAMRCAFSADDRTLATGGSDGVVKLWNTASWREVMAVPAHRARVTLAAFVDGPAGSPRHSAMLVTASGPDVRVWRAASPPGETPSR